MSNITMYSTRSCLRAGRKPSKKQRSKRNELWVDQNQDDFVTMIKRTARRSVPQIFSGDRHIGGFSDLVALDLSDYLRA